MENSINKISCGIDPFGKVFEMNGKIFRQFNESVYPFYRDIINDKTLMENLIRNGLVESWISSNEINNSNNIIEHRRIKYKSFSIEWSFDMFKDAALKTIEIYKQLIKYDYGMKDAHPYNILFDFSNLVYIDFSSIIKFNQNTHRKGWKRSFFGEFFIPLYLFTHKYTSLYSHYFYWENKPKSKERFFIFLNELSKMWNKSFDFSLNNPSEDLEKVTLLVKNLDLKYKTKWEDYYSRGEKIVQDNEKSYTNKERSALTFLSRLKGENNSVLDIASNEGWFALVAENMGYEVVAFDYDERAINNLYLKIRNSNKKILPVVMNFLSPTKAHGIGNNWPSAEKRFKCDITLAMAIIHHLSLSQNLSFADFAKKLSNLTNNYSIVEFIDRDDIHIKNRLKDWYTKDAFLDAMQKYFTLLDCLPSEPLTRSVYLFKKK